MKMLAWLPIIASFMAIGIVLTVGLRPVTVTGQSVSLPKRILTWLFFFIVAYLLITVTERMLWLSSNQYPSWFVTTRAGQFKGTTVTSFEHDCKDVVAYRRLPSHAVALRCGVWWPLDKVMVVGKV